MTNHRSQKSVVSKYFRRLTLGLSLFLGLPGNGLADENTVWKELNTATDASLRGLCVVDEQIVWASGSQGTVLLSTDAGVVWKNVSVHQAGELDFRDIHAFDAQNATVLSAGQPARIYQTEDGGKNWSLRFEHPDERSFFDALSFWDQKHGIAMSDPVDGRVLLIETRDGGRSWHDLRREHRPVRIVRFNRIEERFNGGEGGV